MTAAALERRYRRMLACYPAEHRSIYGEEMIGVLLAGAHEGQRRPGAADTLDLVGGGARARLRILLTGAQETSHPVPQLVARIAIILVAMAGLPAQMMPAGRRLILLMAVIPGPAFVVAVLTFAHVQFYDMSLEAAMASLYLLPLALAGLTFIAARRAR